MLAKVLLLSPPYKLLSYNLPIYFNENFWKIGQRVIVPVGKSSRVGVIAGFEEKLEIDASIKIKDIIWPLEVMPLINDEIVELSHEMGIRHGLEQGACLAAILPTGLKRKNLKIGWIDNNIKKIINLSGLDKLSPGDRQNLAQALESNDANFLNPDMDFSDLEICSLLVNLPWPVRPAAKKQIEILNLLQQKGQLSRKQIIKTLGQSAQQALQKLIGKNYIKLEYAELSDNIQEIIKEPFPPSFTLVEEQINTLHNLVYALNADKPETRLLFGITGSGKTAVYLELAREAVKRGKSVLLLAPEVALAHKLFADVTHYLPEIPSVLYHGYQHPAIRERRYREISRSKNPLIVVGTRSSLFLPLRNPGCIILDEEHDASYKQDEKIPYNAKEIAWQRIRKNNGLLVLGSATPDLRVYYAAKNNTVPLLKMSKRIGDSELPPIELAPLKLSAGIGGNPQNSDLLSAVSKEALQSCLEKGEQAVILLNRRGYAPMIFCLTCKETIKCPHCQIGMTYHKQSGRLLCHYCDYAISWPAPCPQCGNTSYIPIGEGTEKVSEYLEGLTGKKVLRLDRDSARKPGQIDEILTAFGRGESPFLVGTQMLSKGHHFPNVTLVVVADGDIGLNLPDYRAAEKTFQLVTQAAGRAGRGGKKGKAIIQTRNVNHYCWQNVQAHDYEAFYESELPLRKKYLYPPFIKLGLIRISYLANELQGREEIKALGEIIRTEGKKLGIKCLGPAPAPLPMLMGKKRFQCLVKANDWRLIRELWFAIQKNRAFKFLRLQLDLDPMNML